jgi:hypothetical protein
MTSAIRTAGPGRRTSRTPRSMRPHCSGCGMGRCFPASGRRSYPAATSSGFSRPMIRHRSRSIRALSLRLRVRRSVSSGSATTSSSRGRRCCYGRARGRRPTIRPGRSRSRVARVRSRVPGRAGWRTWMRACTRTSRVRRSRISCRAWTRTRRSRWIGLGSRTRRQASPTRCSVGGAPRRATRSRRSLPRSSWRRSRTGSPTQPATRSGSRTSPRRIRSRPTTTSSSPARCWRSRTCGRRCWCSRRRACTRSAACRTRRLLTASETRFGRTSSRTRS